MRKIVIVFSFIFAISFIGTNAQVVDNKIAGKYEGKTKKGLAKGQGIATGVCKFEGYFKEGKKVKTGKYTFEDGSVYVGGFDNDMKHGKGQLMPIDGDIIEGYWKNDIYVGEELSAFLGYEIVKNHNCKPILSKNGDLPNIEFDFSNSFGKINGYSITEYSSGLINDGKLINVTFPLDITVQYSVPNKSNTFMVDVMFKVTILEKGLWKITCNH